ncbi:MAG: Rpp14/Pop5 family protein [Candidatus Bathyarchaeota archaeon]
MVKLFRRRYIAFKLNSAPTISKRELLPMLISNMEAVSKEDSEQYHIRIIKYDAEIGLGVVRCDHRAVNLLLVVLRNPNKTLGNYDAKTIGISGSIKTLRRKFLQD